MKQIAKAYIEITDYCGLECDFCTPEKSKNKTDTMSLDIAIYEKEKFIKNSTMVFAHLPKKLKARLNPTGK